MGLLALEAIFSEETGDLGLTPARIRASVAPRDLIIEMRQRKQV